MNVPNAKIVASSSSPSEKTTSKKSNAISAAAEFQKLSEESQEVIRRLRKKLEDPFFRRGLIAVSMGGYVPVEILQLRYHEEKTHGLRMVCMAFEVDYEQVLERCRQEAIEGGFLYQLVDRYRQQIIHGIYQP